MIGLNTSNSSNFQTLEELENRVCYKPNLGFGDIASKKGYLNCQVCHRLIHWPSWGQQEVPHCKWPFPTNSSQYFIPMHQFCGPSCVEYEGVLHIEQTGLLITTTLARHHKDRKVDKKWAYWYQEEPWKEWNFHWEVVIRNTHTIKNRRGDDKGVLSSVSVIFMGMANQNRIFRCVKFSIKTDRNG